MGEKKLKIIGPGYLSQVIKEANELLVKKEDIVKLMDFKNDSFVLVYYG